MGHIGIFFQLIVNLAIPFFIMLDAVDSRYFVCQIEGTSTGAEFEDLHIRSDLGFQIEEGTVDNPWFRCQVWWDKFTVIVKICWKISESGAYSLSGFDEVKTF